MKRIIFLSVLLVFLTSVAQQKKDFTINWKDVQLHTSSSTIVVPGFDEANFEYSTSKGVRFVARWDESAVINKRTASLQNIQYQVISPSDLKGLDVTAIPSKLEYEVRSTKARDRNQGFVSVSPIIKEGTLFKKITAFEVVYAEQVANNSSTKSIAAKSLSTSNSVLATGEWFRFYVDKSGVFKITPDFLSSLGMDVSSINPATIKIYGNGGRMMPLLNRENSAYDLRENAIQLIGGEDGRFDGNDYILFYGEGTTGFSAENSTNLNLYADKSYYYVTAGGNNGKRIVNYVEPDEASTTQINTFTDYQFYEVDENSVAKLGRRWFGDRFDIQTTRQYAFNFPNLVTTAPVELKVYAAAVATSASQLSISAGGDQIGQINFGSIGGTSLGSEKQAIQSITATSDQVNIQLQYNKQGNPSAIAYLDFISVKAQRRLIAAATQMLFSSDEVATLDGVGEYTIGNTASVQQVWDVTNPASISAVENTAGQATIRFKTTMGEPKQYITVVDSDVYQPLKDAITRVENQDIKGTIFRNAQGAFEDVDYIIIADQSYLSAANALAQHHRDTNNYNVKIVTLDKIYHEFSSGKQDIVAIRNMVKYVYDNASAPTERIKYLCLLGDASIDYKNRLEQQNCKDSNIVPTFESVESFSLLSSFVTDDFFGSMDPDEGLMVSSDQLDIAVGRILSDTPQVADAMVAKIIKYDQQKSLGRWRNSMLLISDDVDADWEESIQRNLDELGDELVERKPFLNITKIYADAFKQESSSSGDRYPVVNQEITRAIESGAIVVDYFGHGGEDGLAKEFVFNKSNAAELKNEYKWPVLITVTCEFTKFDNPCRETAGEFTYTNTQGGVVGLISTTRDVNVNFGISVNDRLSGFLFPDGSSYPSVAEAVRQMKNSYTTNSRRVVVYFGDPAMKLAIPKPSVRLTTINDTPISGDVAPLEALSKVKIAGEVVDASGTLLTDYNGILSTTIYDKDIERQTLANDGTKNTSGEIIKLNFSTLGEVIFRGKASVKNGAFEFEFVVPRDIGIPVANGRISFYAARDGVLEDQSGADETIRIGGINENAPEDTTGPQISLFMNDENFISGGVTDDSPVLIAKLQDENGINTASGIGHDISAILDGDDANPYIMNDFYETEIDDFTKGVVNFKFRDLEPGLHTLTFKGWDVYNNSSTQELQFVVKESTGFSLNNVLNYPNPFVSHTEFWFEHSGAAADLLEVQIQVFTVSGKVIWTTNQSLSGKNSYTDDIQWDGKDDFGQKLGKGVYVYKISVKSTLTNQRVEKFEKLVLL